MINIIIFINIDVKNKLLKGLRIKSMIRTIDNIEQVHFFFVSLVKIIKLNGVLESI